MKRLLTFLSSAAACAWLLAPSMASALTFSPPMFDASGDPGQTITRSLTLRNDSGEAIDIAVSTANFTGKEGDETQGVPDLYPTAEHRDGHGLGAWIVPEKTAYALLPGQSAELSFTVRIPAEAGPGSYFGAVVLALHAADAAPHVGVVGTAAALVFLRVNGDAVEDMALDGFSAPAFSSSLPVRFEARVRNGGTVHLRPYGEVTVKNIFGRTVATLAMNRLEYKSVLPGRARRYATIWVRQALPDGASKLARQWQNFAFGPYTAELTLRYGANDRVVTARAAFWVVPWLVLLIFGGGSLLLLAALRAFLGWHRTRASRRAASGQ